MARPRHTEAQRRAARERIMTAVIALYGEGGLEGISMRAVADRLGVAPSFLYQYYSGRAEMLDAIWRDVMLRTWSGLVEDLDRFDTPLDRIAAILNGYGRFAAKEPQVFREAFLRTETRDRAEAAQAYPFLGLLRAEVEAAQEAGTVRTDLGAATLAQILWSGLHGAVALPVNMSGLGLAPGNTQIGPTVAVLLDGLRPR